MNVIHLEFVHAMYGIWNLHKDVTIENEKKLIARYEFKMQFKSKSVECIEEKENIPDCN